VTALLRRASTLLTRPIGLVALASFAHLMAPRMTCLAQRAQNARSDDSRLFSNDSVRAAVVRLLADSAHGARLVFDPYPLPDDIDTEGGRMLPTSADLRSESGLARLDVIQQVAVRSLSDSVRAHCAGTLAPPIDGSRRSCPSDYEMVAVIGTPHLVSQSRIDSLKQSWGIPFDRRLVRSIRVIVSNLGPHGRNTTVFEYVVSLTDGKWALVSRVPQLFIE
jgi:hypothetical protein